MDDIEIPENLVYTYMAKTAGFTAYSDPRENYYMCQALTMLLSIPQVKMFLIDHFGKNIFTIKYNKIMRYHKMLALVQLYYDEMESKSPDKSVRNSDTFKDVVKIQSQIPLIMREIWEMLMPVWLNSNIKHQVYKEHHYRAFKDRLKEAGVTIGHQRR